MESLNKKQGIVQLCTISCVISFSIVIYFASQLSYLKPNFIRKVNKTVWQP